MFDEDTTELVEDMMAVGRTLKTFMSIGLKIAYITHIMACLWVFVGRLEFKNAGDNPHNWLTDLGWSRSDINSNETPSIYLAAYYFCFTTMTSVGYGDISPGTDDERIFSIVLQGAG